MNNKRAIICVLLGALIIGVLSISSHGLWVDEAVRIQSANYRGEENFWLHQYDHLQIGLCHLQYLWGTLWGKTEVAYRSINVIFLLIASAYLILLLKKYELSPLWAVVFCAHPLCTYYINDASPYIMILACSCAVYYHAFFSEKQETWSNSSILLGWLLFGFYLHFIFGFVCFLYICWLIWRILINKRLSFLKKQIVLLLFFAPLFLYLAYTYLQHMGHGADRGWTTPGAFNAGVAGYCFIGLNGLGLPRNDMRMGDLHLITPYMISCVLLMLISLSIILAADIKKLATYLKEPHIISTFVLSVVFFIAAYSRNFQFWERHVMFLFPPFFITMAAIYRDVWSKTSHMLYRSVIILSGALLILSSAQLRWKYDYQKDDLKGAILYLKTNGFINSFIPILAQGNSYIYKYYNCANYCGDIPKVAPTNIQFINSFSTSKIITTVEELAKKNPLIILILTQQDAIDKKFYKNASTSFEQKGYIVTTNTNYNTVKILFLKKASE